MLKRRFRLPSPALVISMIALSLVLGGTAFAASGVVTAKHKDAKADTKLVKKLAPSLSVKHAKTATNATNAVNATNATNAVNATHATSADSATHATSADSATTAGNASQLGGSPASSYELTNNIMWAVIGNNGATATVLRSSPGVTAARNATGNVSVTFPRDVSGCGWTATQGNPGNTGVSGDFATVRGDGTSTDVEVITWNTTPSQIDVGFHVLVTC
jgi:hypothetical protein